MCMCACVYINILACNVQETGVHKRRRMQRGPQPKHNIPRHARDHRSCAGLRGRHASGQKFIGAVLCKMESWSKWLEKSIDTLLASSAWSVSLRQVSAHVNLHDGGSSVLPWIRGFTTCVLCDAWCPLLRSRSAQVFAWRVARGSNDFGCLRPVSVVAHAPQQRAICTVPHQSFRHVHNPSRECSVIITQKEISVQVCMYLCTCV